MAQNPDHIFTPSYPPPPLPFIDVFPPHFALFQTMAACFFSCFVKCCSPCSYRCVVRANLSISILLPPYTPLCTPAIHVVERPALLHSSRTTRTATHHTPVKRRRFMCFQLRPRQHRDTGRSLPSAGCIPPADTGTVRVMLANGAAQTPNRLLTSI